jgi:hypothetical protein
MTPPRKSSDSKSPTKDLNEISSSEIGGNAVVVQGADAHIDILHQEATPSDIKRKAEMADLVLLKHTILGKLENLNKQIGTALEKGRNPYGYGQALNYKEADLLAGREAVISNIIESLKINNTGFVAGNGGSGKTSLLQAGLMSQMVRQGNLPVFISVAPGALETRIKREFLGEVTQTLYLNQVPLSTFLRHVTECLPQTKHLYLFIDQFEDFLSRPSAETEAFKQEWIYCTSDIPRIHWLFSIHLGSSHLLNFFQPEINPFRDLVVLSPLDRESARQVILKPAAICGFKVEDSVVEDILDKLGGSNIDPGQLQTICYLMAGGNGPVQINWTMADYEKNGRADGILSQSLERLIEQLKHGDRDIAWRILASLAEQGDETKALDGLVVRLKSFGIQAEDAERTLKALEGIHLVDVEDEQYRLAHQSMRPRIQQWMNKQSTLVKAREEVINQLRQLRNSALRGLFGGALGFILFDQLIYPNIATDLSYFISFMTTMALIGGISGFLLTLTVDLSNAAYRGSRAWIRYLVGAIGGMVVFTLAILFYVNINYTGDALLPILPAAALEGGLWGAVIGLGTTYALGSRSRVWLITLATAAASGLVLMGLESILSALVNEAWKEAPSALQIFLAGAVVPLCYITAALFRRTTNVKWN